MAGNLDRDLSIAMLADRAGMSLRSFCRRYRERVGRTPAEGVEIMRVEGARRRLKEGATVKSAARQCGFGTAETMRRAFLRRIGVGRATTGIASTDETADHLSGFRYR